MIASESINVNSIYWKRYLKFITYNLNQHLGDNFFEVHHIIPRCCGGTNDTSNLIKLTFRQHFIAHWMLSKVGIGSAWYKLRFAFGFMSSCSKTNNYRMYLSSMQFSLSKKIRIETLDMFNKTIESPVKNTTWYIDDNNTYYRCSETDDRIILLGLSKTSSPLSGSSWYTDGTNYFMLKPDDQRISMLKLFKKSPAQNTKRNFSEDSLKNIKSDRTGRYWYNDGIRSYKLKENDVKINQLNLLIGRIISDDGMYNIRQRAKWTRTEENNIDNSTRQKGKKRYNDGIKNYTLYENDKLITELNLIQGVIMSVDGLISLKLSSSNKDVSYLVGKKWYNDGKKNYRLDPDNPIVSSLIIGKIRTTCL